MRVALVSSWPPDKCGTADGAHLLAEHLEACGAEVARISCSARGCRATLTMIKDILRTDPDVVHYEFPTMHHGSRVAPHLYPHLVRKPTVFTLHEFRRLRLRRRLLCLFSGPRPHFVFPARCERAAAERLAPWLRGRFHDVPIGSNIPKAEHQDARDPNLVTFFGLLGPNRGIEKFLNLAAAANLRSPHLRFQIVGHEHWGACEYIAAQRATAARSGNISWRVGLEAKSVAAELARSRWAYLPYPDGAAENRGTLLAALENGCAVVTTAGRCTTDEIRKCVLLAATPDDALRLILRATIEPSIVTELAAQTPGLLERHRWDAIANAYLAVYRRAINRR